MSKPVHYHYDKFPPSGSIDWSKLISLIGPASAAVARYDGTLTGLPNPAVLLSPLTTQEAVLSSRIEGTVATISEVLEYEAEGEKAGFPEKKKDDINEILNYRQAIREAEGALDKLPLCQRVVKSTHKTLMQGVRGHNKSPGQYRKIPNWIGSPGCTIETARYVPISVDKLQEGMSRWEKYIHLDLDDKLVQLAIIHAEFESLHPFLDGNGRIGRMFVPLFLFKAGLIQRPMFYISAFFDDNKDDYYDMLLRVSRDGDWTQWCAYFLKAVESQAKENQAKAVKILKLYEKKKKEIHEATHSQYSIYVLDFLFERPIFRSTDLGNMGKVPKPSVKKIISDLRNCGIINVIKESSGSRPAMFTFSELLNIAEGKEIF